MLSRALVEIFSEFYVKEHLAFRGGTALHKLHFDPPARYSEDIDLVQKQAEPIGELFAAIRERLDAWLPEPSFKQVADGANLIYRFQSEIQPITPLRLKVEINTREHIAVFGYAKKSFAVKTEWFRDSADLTTYDLHELLGTKLRALYQRRKGRDLYDLAMALRHFPHLDAAKVVDCFQQYLKHGGFRISRAQFEANMEEKLRSKTFTADIPPLLTIDAPKFDPHEAYHHVQEKFIARLPGEPWKGRESKR